MKKYLIYVSLLALTGLYSCGTSRNTTVVNELPEIISTSGISRKFNMQIDFMKNHFSGMLIARKMENEEIRLLFTTYFGLSVFDFSLHSDSLHVNSCVEPMKKERILRLLENDFKIIFLPEQNMRIKQKSAIFEKRTNGRGFGRTVVRLSEYYEHEPQRIEIKHPWIRLGIQIDSLEKNND